MITFKMQENDQYTVIEFEIEKGVLTPGDLAKLAPPSINFRKGVILSGRGPIWLYCVLIHHYHPSSWIGCNDPRIGAVVVQSHHPNIKVGQVIPISNTN